MRIFVGGSLRDVPRDEALCREFASCLGKEIVKQGHTLITGCRSSLDVEIAKAADEWLAGNSRDTHEQIVSYCHSAEEPAHRYGIVRTSALPDWQMNHAQLRVPEQIENATVTIFVAGSQGTFWAKNWAYYARKPILGIPRFGGAGMEIYDQELKRLRENASDLAERYETLNQLTVDMAGYAKDVVALAEHLVTPHSVFAVMSFKEQYCDVVESFQQVCQEFGFELVHTGESQSRERIIPRIESGIRQSAFIIADVTEPSPNVFYEVGFAKALGKDVILTARKGTELPFDFFDLPTIFWEYQKDLKEELRRRLQDKYGSRRRQ